VLPVLITPAAHRAACRTHHRGRDRELFVGPPDLQARTPPPPKPGRPLALADLESERVTRPVSTTRPKLVDPFEKTNNADVCTETFARFLCPSACKTTSADDDLPPRCAEPRKGMVPRRVGAWRSAAPSSATDWARDRRSLERGTATRDFGAVYFPYLRLSSPKVPLERAKLPGPCRPTVGAQSRTPFPATHRPRGPSRTLADDHCARTISKMNRDRELREEAPAEAGSQRRRSCPPAARCRPPID